MTLVPIRWRPSARTGWPPPVPRCRLSRLKRSSPCAVGVDVDEAGSDAAAGRQRIIGQLLAGRTASMRPLCMARASWEVDVLSPTARRPAGRALITGLESLTPLPGCPCRRFGQKPVLLLRLASSGLAHGARLLRGPRQRRPVPCASWRALRAWSVTPRSVSKRRARGARVRRGRIERGK